MARNIRRPLAISAVVLALGTALVACSPPNQIDSEEKVVTASEGAIPSTTANATSVTATPMTTTSATNSAEEKLTVSQTENLAEGDEITVEITGLDPAMGYYTAICAADPTNPQPVCTGDLSDPTTSAWIKADNTGTVLLNADGTAVVKIAATATGPQVDCHTDKCVVKVFGDPAQNFKNYAEVPVTFAH